MLGKIYDSFQKERVVYLLLFGSIWVALLLGGGPIWVSYILAGSTLFTILAIVVNDAWSNITTRIVLAIVWSLLLAFTAANDIIMLIPNKPLGGVFAIGLLVQWVIQSITLSVSRRKVS